ncbi:MAG TPA: hypothetical protein VF169_26745 [Albitalea sp.]|uniref:glycine-rich domain-containing protein n=1 Tax=Piscinibacter sp. TaxID=1903157 RepID=UPI002ED55B3F
MTVSDSKTLAQTIAAIEALDLAPIKFKATRSEDGYGWTAAHADQVEIAYKRYLILHAKHPEMTLAPDQDTDRFWHMHILDTRKYAADCDAIFGRFLHHFPYLGLRGEDDAKALDDAFAAMQRLVAEEFGDARAQGDAAWCAVEPTAAWCAIEPTSAKAAWCAIEPTKAKAAWCAIEPSKASAAWCAIEPGTKATAAWCAIEPTAPTRAAWCAIEPTRQAA